MRDSAMLPTIVKMCERLQPNEGTMELYGHAFATFSAVSGTASSEGVAKALVSAGVVGLSNQSQTRPPAVRPPSSTGGECWRCGPGGSI